MYDAGRIILEESKSQNDLSDSTSQVGLKKNKKSGGNQMSNPLTSVRNGSSIISQDISDVQL